MPLQVTRYLKSRTHSRNFIITVMYLFKLVFVLIFPCHANMHLNTTHDPSAYSVLQMAYVHPWRNRSISRQWKNRGDAPTDIRHCYKCFAQTPGWTRCRLHEGSLPSMVWCQVQHHHILQCFLEVNKCQCQCQPTRKMTPMTWDPSLVQRFYVPFSWHVHPVGFHFFLPHLLAKLSS